MLFRFSGQSVLAKVWHTACRGLSVGNRVRLWHRHAGRLFGAGLDCFPAPQWRRQCARHRKHRPFLASRPCSRTLFARGRGNRPCGTGMGGRSEIGLPPASSVILITGSARRSLACAPCAHWLGAGEKTRMIVANDYWASSGPACASPIRPLNDRSSCAILGGGGQPLARCSQNRRPPLATKILRKNCHRCSWLSFLAKLVPAPAFVALAALWLFHVEPYKAGCYHRPPAALPVCGQCPICSPNTTT